MPPATFHGLFQSSNLAIEMADSNSQNSGVKRSAIASPSRNDGGAHDANHASSQNPKSSDTQKKHRGRPRVGSHHPIAVVGVHGQNSILAAFGTPLSPKKPTAKVACPHCTLENSPSATKCRVCDGALSGQLVPCITGHHLAPVYGEQLLLCSAVFSRVQPT